MLTRRKFVTGAIAAGVLLRTEAGSAKAAEPFTASVHGEPATPVNFEIPPHACDCHTHFYGDPKVFPLSPAHLYTPQTFHPEDMSALHRALHMERVVIVTPSVYGPNNNGSTLFGVKARGATARGIAVVDDKTPDSDFDAMMQVLSGASRVVFVNYHVDRPWQDPNNAVLANGASRYPDVFIADWATLAAQNPQWFGGDGTHLAIDGPGATALAMLITSTLATG